MSTRFYPLVITDLVRETEHAVTLEFAVPDALKATFAFKAGQHLTVRTTHLGEEVRRNYSLCVAPQEGQLKIAIKHVDGGVFSTWANAHLKKGESLDVMPAIGRFTWPFQGEARHHYVGIAAGSGITPILSLLKTALQNEPNSEFTLLYGNRSAGSILFLEELADLKNIYMGRLAVHHFLSGEADEIEWFNGRLDRAKLDEIFTHLIDTTGVAAFFICGPAGVMEAASATLQELGVASEKILAERFSAGAPAPTRLAATDARVQAAAGVRFSAILEGRRRTIIFDPSKINLLSSIEAAGIAAPYACKAGVCATCRAKLISGRVEMLQNYGLSASELAQGYILTCQSFPLSDDVIIDYDG